MQPIAHISSHTLQNLTLPELIDYHLEHNPNLTFTVFPGESADDEPSRVSYLEFGRATQRFARAICPTAPVKSSEVVGLVANCDALMYTTAIAGFIRAGFTASTFI
jgi:acyl-CoA synthetase (AMP-forming)/AMP-acid ligase II